MESEKFFVVLHGHFYQPPREDPRTGEIELQPSAYPYHDWNEKIHHQCYAANAASRVLNDRGEVERIVNNYRYISFNFGPTLMSWLRKKAPFTYQRILEADRESRVRNGGHGNAIAQVYNHQILPLSSDQDKITQIEWGLASFKKDFKRDAEGIWLAETAINQKVVDLLIDYKIRFVILSPTQVQSLRTKENGEWQDVSDGSIDTSVPYRLKGRNGELAVFFYDQDLARKISFEHLLRNAGQFRRELLNKNIQEKEGNLVHIATDGETYGHHEPFGDMCLSRLIDENEKDSAFVMTNYGFFLDQHPATKEVQLKDGNEGLGTAWSCVHGVDRWRKNCGCHTGGESGWTQEWREPLRQAFDFLRDRLYETAHSYLDPLFGDVWKLRNAFIEVIESEKSDFQVRENFLNHYALHRLTKDEKIQSIRLLEALHYELLMYTSCGWFFAEISGIETVQDMKYASRVLELSEDLLPPDTRAVFEQVLSRGQSNISEFQNGSWIFNQFVEQHRFVSERVINEYFLFHLLTEKDIPINQTVSYYSFKLTVQLIDTKEKGEWKITKSILDYENPQLLEKSCYVIYLFRKKNKVKSYIKKYLDDSLILYLDKMIEKDDSTRILRDFQDWFLKFYSMSDLKYDTKQAILPKMFENTLERLHRFPDEPVYREELFEMILLYKELQVVINEKDRIGIIEFIQHYIHLELDKLKNVGVGNFDFTDISRLIRICRKSDLKITTDEVEETIQTFIAERLTSAIQNFSKQNFSEIEKLIDFSNITDLNFDKYEFQNLIYFRLEKLLPDYWENRLFRKVSRDHFQQLIGLGKKFNLAATEFESFLRCDF